MVIKHFIALLIAFSTTILQAQYNSKGPNKSRFKPGIGWNYKGLRPADSNKVNRYDRMIVDVGHCSWQGYFGPFNSGLRSVGYGLNFMFDKPLAKNSVIALGYGLQYKYSNIHFNQGYLISANSEKVLFGPFSFQNHAAFQFHQVSIPLELRIRNASWRHFKVHLGGSIGYAFGEHFKTITHFQKGKVVKKDFQVVDFNPIQYGVHVRLGLRNVAVMGGYQFSTVFESAESVQLNTLFLGLSFSIF